MANVYIYDSIAIAAASYLIKNASGELWSCSMFDGRKSEKGDLFLRLTMHQMHELALQYMQWQRQTEGVGPSRTPV